MRNLLFGVVVMLILAACGGGGDNANRTPTALPPTLSDTPQASSLPFRPDQAAVYMVNADGSGLRQLFAAGDYITTAVSPKDGRIAVAANNSDRTADLYLLDPESGDREHIEHAEAALYVGEWSPDGNWLAISGQDNTSGTIEMYSLASGQTSTVADGYIFGSQWTADSTSFYAGTNDPANVQRISVPDLGSHAIEVPDGFDRLAPSPDGSQLAIGSWIYDETEPNITNGYRISLAGPDGSGRRELARLPDNTFVIGAMTWSPDGTRVAYGWAGLDREAPAGSQLDSGIFVIDVATGETTRVSDANEGVDMGFSWSPDGERVIIHRGVCTQCDGPGSKELLAAADGSSTLDLPGTEQFQFSDGAWSPDGARFAYSGDRLYVADADGSNVQTVVDLPNSSYQQIAWSKDSQRVFFVRTASLGKNLYALQYDGSNVEAFGASPDLSPLAVAPDGETFAGAGEGSRLAISKADGSTVAIHGGGLDDLDVNQAYSAAFTWSPDGDHVAIELGEKGGETVAIADLTGVATVIDTPNKGGPVRWSPDSAQLAYWADGVIWAVDVDGGSPRRVADADVVPLDWSPDGSELAFVRDGNVVRAPSDGSGSARVLFPAAVGGLGTIGIRWSPDGERIALSGGSKLLVGPADGGATTELVSIATLDAFEWSADSTSIAYSGIRTVTEFSSEGGVFVVDAGGGEPLLIVQSNTRYLRLLGPLADGRFVVATDFRL